MTAVAVIAAIAAVAVIAVAVVAIAAAMSVALTFARLPSHSRFGKLHTARCVVAKARRVKHVMHPLTERQPAPLPLDLRT